VPSPLRVLRQPWLGLLTGQDGFRLMVRVFDGDRAETKAMLPIVESFMVGHQLPDVIRGRGCPRRIKSTSKAQGRRSSWALKIPASLPSGRSPTVQRVTAPHKAISSSPTGTWLGVDMRPCTSCATIRCAERMCGVGKFNVEGRPVSCWPCRIQVIGDLVAWPGRRSRGCRSCRDGRSRVRLTGSEYLP
jgi:hypothetical protein